MIARLQHWPEHWLAFGVGILLGVAVLLSIWLTIERSRVRRAREERDHVVRWLHHACRSIRAMLDHRFPEVTSVCNSLETALPKLARIDLEGLEKHLSRLRLQYHRANAPALDARTVARVADMLTQIGVAAEAANLEGIAEHARAARAMLAPSARPVVTGPATEWLKAIDSLQRQ